MKRSMLGLICLGLMSATGIDARGENFVINGDFAAPAVTGTPFITYALNSTEITGWTVISGVNNAGQGSVDLQSSSFFEPDSTAPTGSQTVDLDGSAGSMGFGDPAGGIEQTIAGLTVGTTYTLSFFYANNFGASSSSARVTIDDLTANLTHTGSTQTIPDYTHGTYNFTATASNVLSFASTDPATDYDGIFLDNISIVPATIPEPASFVMLGAGLAIIADLARARRRIA